MPWGAVRESIVSSVDSRWLRTKDSGAEIVHRAYRDAGRLVLERPPQDAGPGPGPDPVTQTQPATNIEGHQVQDLADLVPDLIEASAGYQLKFRVQVVLDDAPDDVRTKVEQLIDSRLSPGPGDSSWTSVAPVRDAQVATVATESEELFSRDGDSGSASPDVWAPCGRWATFRGYLMVESNATGCRWLAAQGEYVIYRQHGS